MSGGGVIVDLTQISVYVKVSGREPFRRFETVVGSALRKSVCTHAHTQIYIYVYMHIYICIHTGVKHRYSATVCSTKFVAVNRHATCNSEFLFTDFRGRLMRV